MAVLNRITMAEVARRAGVSRSAVSAAFSDRASTVVLNPATRKQIRRVAAELGYQPNILSRSFIKQRSYLVGFLGREAFFLFALETLKGIESVLEPTDYSLLTFYNGSWADDQARHLNKSLSRRVNGLILVGAPEAPDGPNHRLVQKLSDEGLPLVQIYRRMFPNVPVIMMDDELTGYLAAKHLIDLGHREIAHVTHSEYADQKLPGTHADARRRADGYLRAMAEAELEPRIIAFDRPDDHGVRNRDYVSYCADATKQLLAQPKRVTGVTTFNDYVAIALYHNLGKLGVRVPDEMSLVGYDDIETASLMRPSLTTVRPDLFQIGELAGRMLLGMMDGQPGEDIVLTPSLMVRQSTKKL